jgi:hypothetical protein
MVRKKKGHVDPWDNLTPTEVCLVVNAEVFGLPRQNYAQSFIGEKHFSLKRDSDQKKCRRNAYALIQAWKDPGVNYAVGTAKWLIDSPIHRALSIKLGLFEQAKCITNRHSPKCERTCRDLFHAGEAMPDFGGVAMISAISGCTSNYVLVSAATPPAPPTTSSGYDSSIASSSSSSESIRESSELLVQHGIFPSTQQQLPAAATINDESCIYRNPGLMDSCVSDIEVDALLSSHPELFLAERLEWLSVSKDFKRHFTFIRLLQHWAVQEGIHVKALTRLLGLLHDFCEPNTMRSLRLPRDGRTLLKIPKASPFALKEPKQYDVISPPVPGGKLIGRYIHFGLEDALTGTSIGLVHRYHYITLLRRIHTVFPSLLPEEILELTKPGEDEPYNKTMWVNWLLQKTTRLNNQGKSCDDPVIFEVKINVDGVQWFKASKVKGTPVLGKLIAIRNLSGTTRVKIPYYLAKPFVIGIHEQIHEKPPVEVLMQDTLEELVRLQPNSLEKGQKREGEPYAIELSCMSCDGPMRCEFKGIKFGGYWSCERCRAKGVYLNNLGVEVVKKPKKLTRKQEADEARRKRLQIVREQLKKARVAGESAADTLAKIQAAEAAAGVASRKRIGSTLEETSQPGRKKRRTLVVVRKKNPKKRNHQTMQKNLKKRNHQTMLLANPRAVSHNLVKRSLNGVRHLPKRSRVTAQPTAAVRRTAPTATTAAASAASQTAPIATTAAATSSQTATAVPTRVAAAKAAAAAALSDRKAKKAKKGGSTYFPEVRAEPRTDANWKYYVIPETKFDVSIYVYIHFREVSKSLIYGIIA